MNDADLYNMSDEALEEAFRAAVAEAQSPEVGNDDLEQPFVGSDDNASVDEAAEEEVVADSETAVENEENTEEVETEEVDAEEEYPDVTDDKVEEETQPVQSYKFKANGKEYEFTEDEIKAQFPKIFGQAMDYTKKMQAIKPWRKTIDAIEQAKLGHDDINLMIDVLKGDKGAIAEVLRRTKVDSLEIDAESEYQPKDYGRDDKALAVKDVIDDISADKEYDVTHRILSKDWDDASFKSLTSDPTLIKLLHIDVKSGMYDVVQPIAEKLKVYDNARMSDLDYYKEAAKVYFKEQEEKQAKRALAETAKAEAAKVAKVKIEQVRRETVKEEAVKRKAAAPTKSVAGVKQATNYLEDSDEAFEEWYKALKEKE